MNEAPLSISLNKLKSDKFKRSPKPVSLKENINLESYNPDVIIIRQNLEEYGSKTTSRQKKRKAVIERPYFVTPLPKLVEFENYVKKIKHNTDLESDYIGIKNETTRKISTTITPDIYNSTLDNLVKPSSYSNDFTTDLGLFDLNNSTKYTENSNNSILNVNILPENYNFNKTVDQTHESQTKILKTNNLQSDSVSEASNALKSVSKDGYQNLKNNKKETTKSVRRPRTVIKRLIRKTKRKPQYDSELNTKSKNITNSHSKTFPFNDEMVIKRIEQTKKGRVEENFSDR